MSAHNRQNLKGSFVTSAGWLFADLLLALAMLFLIANTLGTPLKPVKPKPTPTRVAMVTPTPTPLPHLILNPLTLALTVDSNGLLNNSSNAADDVKKQVRKYLASFKNRAAGFVLAYGGAPTSNDVNTALQVASNVENILQTFDKEHFVFIKNVTVYHSPFFLLGSPSSLVKLEVYLYQ